ncbi:MAG: Slp family lipoprotein [Acidiferrobacter sp.]
MTQTWAMRAAVALLALGLAGCAVHPRPEATHIDRHMGLQAVLAHPQRTRGARVRWGGVVVQDNVGPVHSTLTVLAYPLSASGRPRLSAMPEGRFQAVAPGYLDPMLFARGRLVTIVGTVTGTRPGLIGQAHYLYPQVQLLASHVWHAYRPRRRRWNFGFGIGIGL